MMTMNSWCKSAAWSVFKHSMMEKGDVAELCLHTAKNMHSSGFFCLRDSMKSFDILSAEFEGVPDGVRAVSYLQDFISFADGLLYPDILSEEIKTHVPANVTQPFVLVFETSLAAKAGTSRIKFTVHTTNGDFSAYMTLCVHQTALCEPKDSAFSHEYWSQTRIYFPLSDARASGTKEDALYPYERYGKEWEAWLAKLAEAQKKLRINVLQIEGMTELLWASGSKRTGADTWHFDFSLLDRYLDIMLKHGSYKRIVIPAFVAGQTGNAVKGLDEAGNPVDFAMTDGDGSAENYLSCLYRALYRHFAERGETPMLAAHLQDEPNKTDSWLWVRNIARHELPDVPCSEAIYLRNIAHALDEECDIPIPRIDIFNEEPCFYRDRLEKGREFYVYSCCFPEEPEWLRKFIDAPQVYSCLMYIACFSAKASGFLHWGFNHWGEGIYTTAPDARFKGDGFIVYPDREKPDFILSNRALATIEGCEIWELLQELSACLSSASVVDRMAKTIAGSFTEFETDPDAITAFIERLLCMLDTAKPQAKKEGV